MDKDFANLGSSKLVTGCFKFAVDCVNAEKCKRIA